MDLVLRPNRLVRTFDALSQLLNVVLFNGDANESISGRVYRENRVTAQACINAVIFWEDNHCALAYFTDYARAQELVSKPQIRR